MKPVIAGWLSMFLAVALSGQSRGTGALGGAYASQGISRPLGGIGSPSVRSGQSRGFRRGYVPTAGLYASPYAYSFYVPGYFDTVGDSAYFPAASVAPPQLAPGNPPVIINQYFGAPDWNESVAPGAVPIGPNGNAGYSSSVPQPPPAAGVDAAQPGDPIGPAQNYYLIAYRDHSVYTVLAYWLEGNTLHYVTTQNTHNQASLNLIDLDLTKTLNQARSIPFSIPGK